MLGYGPCYHMYEVLPHEDRVQLWRAISKGQRADWDNIFTDYRATVDWPAAYYWRELSEHFPHAKIILSLRDPDSWYASMDKTILEVVRSSQDTESLGAYLVGQKVFGGRFDDRQSVIDAFNQNTKDVQATIPKDRLLTYNLGDGWEPLCTFLGCDAPDAPYPHKNRPDDFFSSMDGGDSAPDNGGGNAN